MSSRNNTTYNNEYTRSAARVGSYFAGAVVGGIAEFFVGGMSGGQVAVTTSGATVAMLAEFAFDETAGYDSDSD